MERTLYQVLGVAEGATNAEIEDVFSAQMSRLESLADAGDADAINRQKFLKAAYDVLSKFDRRALYDLRLSDSRNLAARTILDIETNSTDAGGTGSAGRHADDGLVAEFRDWVLSAPRFVAPLLVGGLAVVLLVALALNRDEPTAALAIPQSSRQSSPDPTIQPSTQFRRAPAGPAGAGQTNASESLGPSEGARKAVAHLQAISEFFVRSDRIARSVGANGAITTVEEYAAVLEMHKRPVVDYLRGSRLTSEEALAETIDLAWTSFAMGQVDMEGAVAQGKADVDRWSETRNESEWRAIEANMARAQATYSSEIRNGIEETARAVRMLSDMH